jgi:hypothetical protein
LFLTDEEKRNKKLPRNKTKGIINYQELKKKKLMENGKPRSNGETCREPENRMDKSRLNGD